MKEPVRLALVGCGGITRSHVRGYQDLFERGCHEFEVTACVDVNRAAAETRAAEIGEYQGSPPPVFTDIDEMIDVGVADAADVCVPHCFHHSVAIGLLDAGLHTLVEKPIGVTVRATRAIIAAAERNDRVLALAEQVRRCLASRACTWAIQEQRLIGDVRMVVVQSVSHQPFNFTHYATKWRGLKLLSGGGMIMDSGAHFADMVQVLFGPVDEVGCTLASYDCRVIDDAPVLGDAPADVEDTWHAVIRFKSGLPLIWTYGRSFYGEPANQATYYGSEGTLYDLGFPFHPFQGGGRAELADGSLVSHEEIQQMYLATLREETKRRLFPYGTTDPFAIEVWDFINAITEDRKPEMDGEDGLRAKALCEACYESAAAGKTVKYEDVLAGMIDAYQKPIDTFWELV